MWAITTHGMPSLHSFKDAETFWNGQNPWKNRDESWRPLDTRRMEHKRLVKTADGGYMCVLFSTPLVTYYPDKIKLEVYSTPSSAYFSWRVRPLGCRIQSANGRHFWEVDTPEGSRFYTAGKNALELLSVRDGLWKISNKPAEVTEWVYDRKLGAQARKLVKPYATWFNTTQRLGSVLKTHVHDRNHKILQIEHLLADPEKYEAYPRLASYIGHPQNAVNSAYLHLGARTQQPVPHDRLPRRTRP